MKKKKFEFPDFNKMGYEEEAKWWDTHDWGEFWGDLEDVDIVFELHKPKDEAIVVRLQKGLKEKLEKIARKKGVNVSALTRMWLMEKIHSGKA